MTRTPSISKGAELWQEISTRKFFSNISVVLYIFFEKKWLFENFVNGGPETQFDSTFKIPSPEEHTKARHTNMLLIRAMEYSFCGPQVGTMNLYTDGGLIAFMRCASYFFPSMHQDFSRTIPSVINSLVQLNEVSTTFPNDVQAIIDNRKNIGATPDDRFYITKASVNPILVLLCVDQGMDCDAQYTPMASPRSNGRSIVSEHVDDVCEKVIDNEYGIIASEDFAIAPYCVVVADSKEKDVSDEFDKVGDDGNDKETGDEPSKRKEGDKQKKDRKESQFGYKCILNRDRNSRRGEIEAKQADALSVDRLVSMYLEVSF